MLENVSKDIFQNNNLRKQLKAKPELPLPSQHRTLCVTPHLWCLHFGLAFEDSDNESESKRRSNGKEKVKVNAESESVCSPYLNLNSVALKVVG